MADFKDSVIAANDAYVATFGEKSKLALPPGKGAAFLVYVLHKPIPPPFPRFLPCTILSPALLSLPCHPHPPHLQVHGRPH